MVLVFSVTVPRMTYVTLTYFLTYLTAGVFSIFILGFSFRALLRILK